VKCLVGYDLRVRYRFGDFVLSPGRRLLSGGGRDVPLIPRYFDLLVLLVEQRDRAVSKQEIFDRVWSDVVVSDNALTQAILTIRRALGDDPRDPRFVRTVSRRGYQFVFAPVAVEDDARPWPTDPAGPVEADEAVEPAPIVAAAPDVNLVAPLVAPARWAAASLCTAAAGVLGGIAGGLAIGLGPASGLDGQVTLTLMLVGALAGAIGGGGVGAGLAVADAWARSARMAVLAVAGASAGVLTGWIAHHGARAVLTGLFGRDVPGMGGAVEGLVLGAASGIGYAIGTSLTDDGRRWRVPLVTGLASGLGAVALGLAGRHLVGSSLDLMAGTFAGSQVGLEPLARLLGDEHLRPLTRAIISGFEGLLFGAGIASGLTWRGRGR
jgi:DNA-binding winged helix-turn-helix (wHTH) protein